MAVALKCRCPWAGSARDTSYFPEASITNPPELICSRYRSRNSRAAAASFGSFFAFGFFSRTFFSIFAGSTGASGVNRSTFARVIADRTGAGFGAAAFAFLSEI
jgi:hypothetical protein